MKHSYRRSFAASYHITWLDVRSRCQRKYFGHHQLLLLLYAA
jgi:hypothetical protein